MSVEPPYSEAHLTLAEARAFLCSWWRVVQADGSTVAYVPDRTTAEEVAGALSRCPVHGLLMPCTCHRLTSRRLP